MRRLVRMVLNGGGTRYMEYNDRVTHVVFGKPSESELKDIRKYAMWGVVDIVLPAWLEECTRQGREVAVNPQFIVPQALLLGNGHWKSGRNKAVPVHEKKTAGEVLGGRVFQRKLWDASDTQSNAKANLVVAKDKAGTRKPSNVFASDLPSRPREGSSTELQAHITPIFVFPLEEVVFQDKPNARSFSVLTKDADDQQPVVMLVPERNKSKSAPSQVLQNQTRGFSAPVVGAGNQVQEPKKITVVRNAGCDNLRCEPSIRTSSEQLDSQVKARVFEGHVFKFAPSFQVCLRAEVIQWVLEGGGVMLEKVNSSESMEAKFMIFPHGSEKDPCFKPDIKSVTTQWIKCCLQEGKLLDISSHILFQPLRCEVPLPGFEVLRFALTQYADSERVLIYNLCHILGAKYQEKKMNKKATHLLCKVRDGEKYEAALKWGVEIVTAEWLYACVAQNRIVPPGSYRPKKLTAAEKEAGLGIPTQNPLQLTSLDSGVPSTERCTAQNSAEVPLPSEENEVVRVRAKGKAANTKRKSSLRGKMEALLGNRPLTECSLTSHNGDNLDPWDQLTASWANDDATRRPTTRSQRKAVTALSDPSFCVVVDLGLGNETQSKLPDDLKPGHSPSDASQGALDHTQVPSSSEQNNSVGPIGFENEEDSGRDVAAAIEGLLAQTSKVQSEEASRSPQGDRDLRSHDMIKLGRRNVDDIRERAHFKRPKVVSNRSSGGFEKEPVQSAPPAEDIYEEFEESQMDSQVVAYDEDHSGRQRIMERARTRSMSTSSSCGSGASLQQKEPSWKAAELKRLLKAADANK